MKKNISTLQENQTLQTEKNIVWGFCDIKNILSPDFNEKAEYKQILDELGILDNFEWKSDKKVILLRHFEDNKSISTNWNLTDSWIKFWELN